MKTFELHDCLKDEDLRSSHTCCASIIPTMNPASCLGSPALLNRMNAEVWFTKSTSTQSSNIPDLDVRLHKLEKKSHSGSWSCCIRSAPFQYRVVVEVGHRFHLLAISTRTPKYVVEILDVLAFVLYLHHADRSALLLLLLSSEAVEDLFQGNLAQ